MTEEMEENVKEGIGHRGHAEMWESPHLCGIELWNNLSQ